MTTGGKAEQVLLVSRLSNYLSRQYLASALSLFAAVAFLVWINQTLRLFELVTAKGQSPLTLMGQALLTTPPLSRAMLYICIGIGIARTLNALQVSRELHTIHATRRIGALWSSLFVTATAAALAAGLLAHWIEPVARASFGNWTEQVAADVVERVLEPHRFREITPGFVVQIGDRLPDGTIIDFFADDSRDPKSRKTYEARRASIHSDANGLYLSLEEGSIQNQVGNSFTEVAFAAYQLGLDNLAEEAARRNKIDETTTYQFYLISQKRKLNDYQRWNIEARWMEIPRMYAMCLFVLSLTGFPRAGRSQFGVPVEIVVVVVALIDRIISDQVTVFNLKGLSGVVLLAGSALAIFGVRMLRPYLPRLRRRAT